MVWLTHPHPALADSLQTIDDNQRIVKGTIDVSLRPFGKVCSLFINPENRFNFLVSMF